MKLLSVHMARSIWLGNVADFNPRGISLYRYLFPFLVETYKFRSAPSMTDITDLTKGVGFLGGDFLIAPDIPISVNITFYNDGIIADTGSSTEDSDAFLVDVFKRFSDVFNMPHYEEVIKRILYLSQVYVSADKSMNYSKFEKINNYLSDNVESGGKSFQLGGLIFMPDQVERVNPSPFRFERAMNVPFSENRFFSAAPLTTSKHLELLNLLEEVLS